MLKIGMKLSYLYGGNTINVLKIVVLLTDYNSFSMLRQELLNLFSAIFELRTKGSLAIEKLETEMDKIWSEGFANSTIIRHYNELFYRVIDHLETAEEDLRLVFSEIMNMNKIVTEPAVKLLTQVISSKPLDEQEEQKVKL